jgi:CheY-like chemotaxis protein
MVVDDEEEIVASLKEFLVREKYEVIGVTDSISAVEEYRNWHPDLLIVDVVMPGLSGVELVQRLREEDQSLGKIIFLSGRTERDTVANTFVDELEDGRFEFFRKPLSLVQIGGRIRDYFTEAQEVLNLNLLDAKNFQESIQHLTPYQLVELQRFLWDRIFEIAANVLGRRIESYYITDRMEPPANYMRRVGCQEREDYCIANECFSSNPLCAAEKIRGELDVMRQIIVEFREEYVERVVRNIGGDAPRAGRRSRRRAPEPAVDVHDVKDQEGPPPRKTLRRLVSIRKR